ncbi:unnamed protein product [Cylindrotheca closterium]|uniref:Mediator complex subunit 15 KIX domain-containing protein n=1 Tax=Cylindrotheca closterium TaxID=2856 RepID=A0AAD2FRR8_9STRA|nr:unnamed protein product [Cylindrotheca closterium]
MSSNPPSPEGAAGAGNNWRDSVAQSYRNVEAREIAKTLAELEPGASASNKLSLAMRFENTVFQSAISLADYRKKLTRRLKKLRKNYKPPVQQTTPTSALLLQSNVTSKEQLYHVLREKYADYLLYIMQNSHKAVQDVLLRHGKAKATQLQQHADCAVTWAGQLGLVDAADVAAAKKGTFLAGDASAATSTTMSSSNPPNKRKREDIPSESSLLKLQQHLEKRVSNIRQYVVKHADSDLFLQETLERKDKELSSRANDFISRQLKQRMQKLASTTSTTTTSTATGTTTTAGAKDEASLEGVALLQDAMDKAQVPIPPSTRTQSNDKLGPKLYIDKMRAASTAFCTYLTMADRHKSLPPSLAESVLPKTNAIVKEGVAFLKEVVEKHGLNDAETADGTNKKHPPLEDAWNKILELPMDEQDVMAGDESAPSPLKRRRLNATAATAPCTKAKVLFRPNRKTPANLLPALQRKRATLVRPKPNGHGSHLVLDFGNFSMTIYFSPLLVTLRANEEEEEDDENNDDPEKTSSETADHSRFFRTRPSTGCASWKPLHHGLAHRRQPNDLTVYGVSKQSYETVGGVVEERLRDASTQATHTLRTCFANHVRDKQQEMEVEILEGSALLEFVQVARTTYMPNWKDDDIST